jgi:hypothetical protein
MSHGYTVNQPPQQDWRPPRKRHRLLKGLGIGLALLVVLVVIAGIFGSGSKGGSGTSASGAAGTGGAAPAAASAGPGIGSKVRDGKFQFTVTRVSHRHSVGDTSLGLGETAQGRYTVLHVKVTNIGNVSQTLDDSSQYVYDSHGRKYDADTAADLDANGSNGGGVFLNDINPGNTVHGVILFDLPKGDKAVKAELHDSAFSGGVTVSLARP